MVGQHLVANPFVAVRQAIERWQELAACARESGDQDDAEAAAEAYLEAVDLAGDLGLSDYAEDLL